jgi:hypothetical protein
VTQHLTATRHAHRSTAYSCAVHGACRARVARERKAVVVAMWAVAKDAQCEAAEHTHPHTHPLTPRCVRACSRAACLTHHRPDLARMCCARWPEHTSRGAATTTRSELLEVCAPPVSPITSDLCDSSNPHTHTQQQQQQPDGEQRVLHLHHCLGACARTRTKGSEARGLDRAVVARRRGLCWNDRFTQRAHGKQKRSNSINRVCV